MDAGRLVGDRGNWPVLRAADRVLLAVRASVRSVHAAQDATTKLRYELGDLSKVSALVIGTGPYSAGEVSAALQISLGGVLLMTAGGSRAVRRCECVDHKQMHRSALMKAAGGLARRVAAASLHPDAA